VFGSTGRRGRIAFHDSTVTDARTENRAHVAIDRISGGSRDKLLFQQTVVTSGRLRLRITALEPLAETERDLLHAVVRDIDDGLIGVGGGGQRGHGTLRLTTVSTTRDAP
jgi:CRISPR/Cas system CSM-associated protein Csm3 (group 7 of RAMP superfamily)